MKMKLLAPHWSWTYVIEDLNGDEVVGTIHKKELQMPNQGLELKK